MTGYERKSGGYPVVWEPDDSAAALDALVNVSGTGVSAESALPSESDLPSDGLVNLNDQPDVQQAVRDEHDRLTTDTTDGGTSG